MTMPPKLCVSHHEWGADLDASYIHADRVKNLVNAVQAVLEKHIAHHNSVEHAAARAAIAEISGP